VRAWGPIILSTQLGFPYHGDKSLRQQELMILQVTFALVRNGDFVPKVRILHFTVAQDADKCFQQFDGTEVTKLFNNG
jgi:hypothetical protein